MKMMTIKARFSLFFGLILLLVCGVGAFSLVQIRTMVSLNRYSNSDLLPAVAVGGRLENSLSNIRVAQGEYLSTADPALLAEADTAVAQSRIAFASGMKNLAPSIGTRREREIVNEIAAKTTGFFLASAKFNVYLHHKQIGAARALYMGELDTSYDH